MFSCRFPRIFDGVCQKKIPKTFSTDSSRIPPWIPSEIISGILKSIKVSARNSSRVTSEIHSDLKKKIVLALFIRARYQYRHQNYFGLEKLNFEVWFLRRRFLVNQLSIYVYIFSKVVQNVIIRNLAKQTFVLSATFLKIWMNHYLWSPKNRLICYTFFQTFLLVFKCSTKLFKMLKHL